VLSVLLVPTWREQPLVSFLPGLPWLSSSVRGMHQPNHRNNRAKSRSVSRASQMPTILQLPAKRQGYPTSSNTDEPQNCPHTLSGLHSLIQPPRKKLSERYQSGVAFKDPERGCEGLTNTPLCSLTEPAGLGGFLRDQHVCQSCTVSSQPQINLSVTLRIPKVPRQSPGQAASKSSPGHREWNKYATPTNPLRQSCARSQSNKRSHQKANTEYRSQKGSPNRTDNAIESQLGQREPRHKVNMPTNPCRS